MEFCNDPQGRQAKAPEQRFSVAIASENEIKGMEVNVEDQDELGSTGGMGKGRWL